MINQVTFQKIVKDQEIQKSINPSFGREVLGYFGYFLKVFCFVAIFYIFIRYFVLDIIRVNGESMTPSFQNQEIIYIDQLTPRFSDYQRGDVVVLKPPEGCGTSNDLFIKRIIGLPGESLTFDDGQVFISSPKLGSKSVKLDESNYLALDMKTYKNVIFNTPKSSEKVLADNEYFFMGDNRSVSLDSRKCGAVLKKNILGKAVYRVSPKDKRQLLVMPEYNIPSI